ncbi:MAG: Hpt domain-containing protein [Lachnospiraceae bacterium]|jgi:HPt (histidine-containing phosphotransfer) domain-containing protein|nr:Hpt domain-containing protein [Lachnospiraceae bacterium]
MTEELKKDLIAAGANIETALARFMNMEAMYLKFLLRFPADPNFESLRDALAAGDTETAFRAAHTLKGVAGNLGLDRFYESVSKLTEVLRAGGSGNTDALMKQAAADYEEICAVIQKHNK